MDRHELNEMFDGLTPSPQRERELLRQLLQDDARRNKPMKNWKRVVVGVAAAALLVTAATAAVVPGISQRLLEYLGIAPEDTQTVELLAPGAMAVDIVKEDNGATLHVTQVLRDRTSIMVLADFTAPEGTVLDLDEANPGISKGFESLTNFPEFLDEAGETIGDHMVSMYRWKVLDDGDPLDNHLSLMLLLNPMEGEPAVQKTDSESAIQETAFLRVPAVDLKYFDFSQMADVIVYSGDWSFDVALPQEDIGYVQQTKQAISEADKTGITVEEIYVSPMTLQLTVTGETTADRDLLLLDCSKISLKDKAGTVVALQEKDGYGMRDGQKQMETFRLAEITDPAQFQGGTLTLELNGGSVTIPLDDLQPVAP